MRTTSRRRGTGRTFGRNQRRRQTGGFLNRYDFTYAGRDTVNQLGKIAPGIIKYASGQIDEIAKKRIEQIIKQGGGGRGRTCRAENNTWHTRRVILNTFQIARTLWQETSPKNKKTVF